MKRRLSAFLLFGLSMLVTSMTHAASTVELFHFFVLGQRAVAEDTALSEFLQHANTAKPSFVVLNGIRNAKEPCHDDVYRRRSKVVAESGVPVIVSLTASDWARCRNEMGRSNSQDRLRFLREVLFEKDLAQHAKSLPVVQQSTAAVYRQYSENIRWEWYGVLFATMNLPSNNNHYLSAAGGNNEFEDRLIANRHWLRRVFNQAKYRKMKAIVLFVDGNPMVVPTKVKGKETRDGFLEMRKHLTSLAGKYPGKILLVHNQEGSGKIVWRRNFGIVGVSRHALDIAVTPARTVGFSAKPIIPVKVDGATKGEAAKDEAAKGDAANQEEKP